jgi:RNA polymerase sigma-70 factor (ECF subfamily)
MNQAEQDLIVLSAQVGNKRAFNLLVSYFHKPLINFAIKFSHDQELARDAVQESWIKVSKNIRQLKDPRAFKSWIYRLVRWRLLDLIKTKNKDNAQLESLDEYHLVDDNNQQTDNRNEVSILINMLPDIEKEMIHLFYSDGLKISEISLVLRIPSGTVKSRLNRARNLLREKYNHLEKQYEHR